MSRFIEGERREQATLFPERIDDYISQENPVRVVNAFVDELNLFKLGFESVQPKATGRPAYHPSTMLKLYIYGYLNKVQSSRKLEREANRNLELIWLLERLAPDFKTIANFGKDNSQAIKSVCRQFVMLCKQMNMFADSLIAIDGSRFSAVNNRDRNYTKAKVQRRIDAINKSLDRYLSQLDTFDRQDQAIPEVKSQHIHKQLDSLKRQMAQVKAIEAVIDLAPGKQISLTDQDARAMSTNARSSGNVGYNVQTAVDTKHHLIVAHDVSMAMGDRSMLTKMSLQAREATGLKKLKVIADRGYFKMEEIKATVDQGITPYVPKSLTSSNRRHGLFDRGDFIYIEADDEYKCPANKRLAQRTRMMEAGKVMLRYWSKECGTCALKPKCTVGKERRVTRWEHGKVIEDHEIRMINNPTMMQIRKQTVEHPFGTIKSWMGMAHFKTKRLKNVSTEISLHVLAYNMTRMINIMGVKPLIRAIEAA
jgi:transposase